MATANTCDCCCTIASDDFGADQLATNWDVRSGTPAVASGVLSMSAGTNLLIHNTAAPADATAVFSSVTFRGTSTIDIVRLVVAYVDDNNYWYAEAQPGSSNGTLKLFERSGGVNTQRGSTVTISSMQTNEDWEIQLCVQPGAVTAAAFFGSLLATNEVVYAATVTVASTKAGLGASESGTITLNDFEFERHFADNDSCRTCNTCQNCSTGQPYQVQVVIAGMANNPFTCTPCLNGTFILTRRSRCQWHLANTGCTTSVGETIAMTLGFEIGNVRLSLFPSGDAWNLAIPPTITDCLAWDNTDMTGSRNCVGSNAALTAL